MLSFSMTIKRRGRTAAGLGLILAALVLAACAGGSTRPESPTADMETIPASETDVPEVYRLASGDKLRISVFGHPDVSGEFEVDGDGSITFPLLGQLKARNKTVNQLKEDITQRLNENYLVDPRVSVEVLNYRPFYILGQVQQPGSYPYQSGMTVRQAVALAGGYTRRAVTSQMTLIRPTEKGPVEMEVSEDAEVLPGDTIEIERRFF